MEEVNIIKVSFFKQAPFTLRNIKKLKRFISNILIQQGKKSTGEIRVIFCTDEELLQINIDFLNHNYYTDIITFPFTEPSDSNIEAELYISLDRIRDNAEVANISINKEIHRVIFHGILHLCGFGDKTKDEILEMRKHEDLLLNIYFKN
ncbi:MAG: rRNA maturation RNase YbeY [Niabella sp.]